MTAKRAYLRAQDIVVLTGMSLRTVRRWIADEILPSTKLGGSRLVATANLEALLFPCNGTIKSDEKAAECDDESDL